MHVVVINYNSSTKQYHVNTLATVNQYKLAKKKKKTVTLTVKCDETFN